MTRFKRFVPICIDHEKFQKIFQMIFLTFYTHMRSNFSKKSCFWALEDFHMYNLLCDILARRPVYPGIASALELSKENFFARVSLLCFPKRMLHLLPNFEISQFVSKNRNCLTETKVFKEVWSSVFVFDSSTFANLSKFEKRSSFFHWKISFSSFFIENLIFQSHFTVNDIHEETEKEKAEELNSNHFNWTLYNYLCQFTCIRASSNMFLGSNHLTILAANILLACSSNPETKNVIWRRLTSSFY